MRSEVAESPCHAVYAERERAQQEGTAAKESAEILKGFSLGEQGRQEGGITATVLHAGHDSVDGEPGNGCGRDRDTCELRDMVVKKWDNRPLGKHRKKRTTSSSEIWK